MKGNIDFLLNLTSLVVPVQLSSIPEIIDSNASLEIVVNGKKEFKS